MKYLIFSSALGIKLHENLRHRGNKPKFAWTVTRDMLKHLKQKIHFEVVLDLVEAF
jgi:hypothetical protein